MPSLLPVLLIALSGLTRNCSTREDNHPCVGDHGLVPAIRSIRFSPLSLPQWISKSREED